MESCDEVAAGAASRARLEPLREYTLSYRDPAHSANYDQSVYYYLCSLRSQQRACYSSLSSECSLCRFKAQHARRYWDDTEEAVRKNLLMQHTRFVASGNRQGATFAMEVRSCL